MVTPQDLQKWQQATQGIDKLQNEFSPDELRAYQNLSYLFKNESFQNNESSGYLQTLKKVNATTKNRLLKAHLANTITLSEKYFTAKAAETVYSTSSSPQNPPKVETPPVFEIPEFTPPPPPKVEPPKVEPQNTEKKTKSNLGLIIIIIIAILLLGGYLAYKYWDTIFPPKNEMVELTDTLVGETTDEVAVLDSLPDNTTATPVDTVPVTNPATTPPAPAPVTPNPVPTPKQTPTPETTKITPPAKKNLTDSEIISLFSDVSIGDNEALDRFIKEVGANITVEGVDNIDNSYELAHDAFLYDRKYSISVQRNSNGKISKIIVR